MQQTLKMNTKKWVQQLKRYVFEYLLQIACKRRRHLLWQSAIVAGQKLEILQSFCVEEEKIRWKEKLKANFKLKMNLNE